MSQLRFTLDDAMKANGEWRFNCGPASLCAILDKTPEEIRPRLLEFEDRGYMNPSMMATVLFNLDVKFRRAYECAVNVPGRWPRYPRLRTYADSVWRAVDSAGR